MVYSALMYNILPTSTKLIENQYITHFTLFCTKNAVFNHFPKFKKYDVTR